jgi:hypothetical protein
VSSVKLVLVLGLGVVGITGVEKVDVDGSRPRCVGKVTPGLSWLG